MYYWPDLLLACGRKLSPYCSILLLYINMCLVCTLPPFEICQHTYQGSWCSPWEAAPCEIRGHALPVAWAEGAVMQYATFLPKYQINNKTRMLQKTMLVITKNAHNTGYTNYSSGCIHYWLYSAQITHTDM